MKKTTKKIAVGTAIAAVGGYVAGLLTAPKSGKETRKSIEKTAGKTIEYGEKTLKNLHTDLNKTIKIATTEVAKLKGKSKEELEMALNVGEKAKDKAREILSAFHEGDADDKDLKKAIDKTTEAIKSLKSFIEK
jgi:gas vesicle protein